jgi:hypothetical protein
MTGVAVDLHSRQNIDARHKAGHDDQNRLCTLLFNLRFAEFDVFLGDRVVFLLHQFVGHGARILPRHIIKPGIRAGYEFNFDCRVLGHQNLKN